MKKKSTKLIDIKMKKRVELYSLRKSLLNLNFQKFTGQLEKTSEIKIITLPCQYSISSDVNFDNA